MDERTARELVAGTAQMMAEAGLAEAFGHVSVRLDGGFAITSTAPFTTQGPEDVIVVPEAAAPPWVPSAAATLPRSSYVGSGMSRPSCRARWRGWRRPSDTPDTHDTKTDVRPTDETTAKGGTMTTRGRRGSITRLCVLVLAVSLVAAACGDDDGTLAETTDVQLILDFVPGGIHAGIYSALAEGYFEDANINIDIQPPTSSADTLRLVIAGQATVGIAPIADVASLRAQGEDIQIFMALEQVPLAALMSTAAIGITDPSQLSGATIGVTGVPSDEAIAKVILSSSGVDVNGVTFVTIGFDAVGNLIGKTVDAAIGFWSAEAVVLELEGETPYVFRPDEYGAPPYPELVLFASTDTINNRPEVLRAVAAALAKGYEFALADPAAAIADLAANADGIDVDFASAEFANVQPYFLGPNGNFGEISDAAISDYLTWAVEVGVLESMPQNLITTEFLP